MAFTYDFNTAPLLSQCRMLIPDTLPPGIFSDDEISQFLTLESSQGLYVSGQRMPTASVQPFIPVVYSVRRAAAMGLDVIAAKLARQAAIESLLDVKQNCAAASAAAAKQAQSLRDQEENMGHFAIAEIVVDQFSARERVYAQLLRIEGA